MTANETQSTSPERRPPVVVVLGHVDHGKTSLLDHIRQTNVAAGESGGITQHTGAYQAVVDHDGEERRVTFIDTPGHAAFHQMRSRGANVADIAILIVAADDGVQPQTKEAVEHIREAEIPFIVAINKIDKDNANPSQAKAELAELDVTVESFGGDTPDVEISATEGTGIDDLLELLLITADLQEFTADPSLTAEGVVVEAELNHQRGPVATLLVRNGTLRKGETIATSTTTGTTRSLENVHGKAVTEAGPSIPTRVLGLNDVPVVGEPFAVVADESAAKAFQAEHHYERSDARTRIAETATMLPVVLKSDAEGTLEALAEMLEDIGDQDHAVSVIHRSTGTVSDGDIKTAEAAGAIVVAFRVDVDPLANRRADDREVDIVNHDVIYELVELVKKHLAARLNPTTERRELGQLKVLAIFRDEKRRMIVGGRVNDGVVKNKAQFDIMRNDENIGSGTIEQLQRGKNNVERVERGEECGLRVAVTERIEEGDRLMVFEEVQTKPTLE